MFETVRCLVERHGRLVTKRELHDQVWGNVVVSDGALVRCMTELRKALGDAAKQPRYIQTVPRLGYRFIERVEAIEPASPPHAVLPADRRTMCSLVVLPFVDLNRDPEQEYFADGFTDLLIADLGRISALHVISRTSAMCISRQFACNVGQRFRRRTVGRPRAGPALRRRALRPRPELPAARHVGSVVRGVPRGPGLVGTQR